MAETDKTEQLIARNLLDARRRLGLTLAEVAASTGISVTHLSRLERGERQPSIGVLLQLARSYGLPLGQLAGEEPAAACRVFRGGATLLHDGPDGKYAAMSGIAGAHLIEAIRLELPGGSRTSRAARHGGEERLLVSSGCLRVEIGTEAFDLDAGDAAHFDAQTPHRLRNHGQSTAIVYIVTAGSPTSLASTHR
ncbi:MAG: helix-turn-helix domain-containing protein [Acetobacteraceae bacterium]